MLHLRWIVAGVICTVAFVASAAMQTNVGDLICTLAATGEDQETPPSQKRAMICTFKPNGSGPEESYAGEIQQLGSRTALDGKRVLIWAVMGPNSVALAPGQLGQTFAGGLASAEGDEPAMLVGDGGTYTLRPVTDGSKERGTEGITVVVLKAKSLPT